MRNSGFDKSYDPYKAAYGSMPSHAPKREIKQLYINGICYVLQIWHCHQQTGHYHLFITKIMLFIRISLSKKKSDSLTKINVFMIQKLLIPTSLSVRKPSSQMQLFDTVEL